MGTTWGSAGHVNSVAAAEGNLLCRSCNVNFLHGGSAENVTCWLVELVKTDHGPFSI
jgi:hypothetical protein